MLFKWFLASNADLHVFQDLGIFKSIGMCRIGHADARLDRFLFLILDHLHT
jgi:hypothetical protein